MLKKILIIGFILGITIATPILLHSNDNKASAECSISHRSGCCSHHGGVCGCSGGRALCCDGALSPSCGCN